MTNFSFIYQCFFPIRGYWTFSHQTLKIGGRQKKKHFLSALLSCKSFVCFNKSNFYLLNSGEIISPQFSLLLQTWIRHYRNYLLISLSIHLFSYYQFYKNDLGRYKSQCLHAMNCSQMWCRTLSSCLAIHQLLNLFLLFL